MNMKVIPRSLEGDRDNEVAFLCDNWLSFSNCTTDNAAAAFLQLSRYDFILILISQQQEGSFLRHSIIHLPDTWQAVMISLVILACLVSLLMILKLSIFVLK